MMSFGVVQLVVCALMVATIILDLKFMRIPDVLSLLLVGLFVGLIVFSLPSSEVIWRIIAAACVFAIGFGLFALRMVGGGDVKVLSSLMLLIPSGLLSQFMLILSLALVLGVLAVVIARKMLSAPDANWAFLRNEKRMPMGLSIGIAGIITMALA